MFSLKITYFVKQLIFLNIFVNSVSGNALSTAYYTLLSIKITILMYEFNP